MMVFLQALRLQEYNLIENQDWYTKYKNHGIILFSNLDGGYYTLIGTWPNWEWIYTFNGEKNN